jgi:hypothetical protein
MFHLTKDGLIEKREGLRDRLGTKRIAVLTEDLGTGEERWMLESQPKSVNSFGRAGFLACDLATAAFIVAFAVASLAFRKHRDSSSLAWVLANRSLTL